MHTRLDALGQLNGANWKGHTLHWESEKGIGQFQLRRY